MAEAAGTTHPIVYVHDAPFHYIVLTRADNTWTNDLLAQYNAVLDQIEASTGPGILVTIGTGNRTFSTGFDLPWWCKKYENFKTSILAFQQTMARIIQMSMPTVCVFNGNAIAAGFFLGLSHDYRIMHEKIGIIQLSELKLGMPLPVPFTAVQKFKLRPSVVTKVTQSIMIR